MPPADSASKLAQTWAAFRNEGIRAVVIKALQELNLYRRLSLIEVPLEPRSARLVPGGRIAIRLLEGTEADLQAYSRLRPDVPLEEVRARLNAEHRCFVASLDGRLASAVWIATGRVRIDYLDCDL